MASETNEKESGPAQVSRRDVLKAGAVGAVGLGAAATLGKTGVARAAAPAIVTRAPQTLNLMSWVQYEPGRNDAWFALLKKFNASQKDYVVKFVGWPANTFGNQVLIQAQAGGIDADVATFIPDIGLRVMQLGLLAPIDDIIKKLGVHPTAAHNFMRQNGHLYGISIVQVPFAILYNSKLLQQAGIEKPADNVKDWMAQLAKLTKKPNQFGIWQPNSPSQIFSWWFQLQEFCCMNDTVWAKGKTPLVNSTGIVNALEVWLEMYQKYMAQGATDTAATRLFDNGQIAEEINVAAGVNILATTAPAIYPYLRSVPPPWPSKKSISRLHPLGIIASTKKMDGAKAFVEFMSTPANQVDLMIRGKDVVPPYPEVNAVPAWKPYLQAQKWATGYLEINAVPFPDVDGDFISHDTEFGNIVTQQFQRALNGSATVQSAMNSAQSQIEASATRWFK